MGVKSISRLCERSDYKRSIRRPPHENHTNTVARRELPHWRRLPCREKSFKVQQQRVGVACRRLNAAFLRVRPKNSAVWPLTSYKASASGERRRSFPHEQVVTHAPSLPNALADAGFRRPFADQSVGSEQRRADASESPTASSSFAHVEINAQPQTAIFESAGQSRRRTGLSPIRCGIFGNRTFPPHGDRRGSSKHNTPEKPPLL